MVCIGVIQLYVGHRIAGYIVIGLASFLLIAAFFSPALYSIIIDSVTRLVRVIVNGLGAVTLGFLYYTLFSLIAIFRSAIGKDPLNRKFPSEDESNWIVRAPQESNAQGYAKLYSKPHADKSAR